MEKSGGGGTVFRNGVDGLYKWKNTLYGESFVGRFVDNSDTLWPAGINRKDLKIEPVFW
jgi:hypothetical protein